MRTPQEIAFRLSQEFTNLRLLARRPQLSRRAKETSPSSVLPDPATVADALRGSAYESEIVSLSKSIREHRFPLLGVTIDTGPQIHWRRDYVNGKETNLRYFRRIPYLNVIASGDHKVIWELNRHQHLVVLAQAYLFTNDQNLLDELVLQLESWFVQNPFQRGINWASALEVAFRALSWIWIYHLVGGRMQPAFAARFLERLYQHGRHIENNLSIYFSPNTHLLGEAVALHALGRVFPQFPRATRWERLGGELVEQQMDRQVRADGSHFEQSTYYHVYALDMFLFHAILKQHSPAYREKLARMGEYLNALLGPSRTLPFIGDDDGGRLFHPFGPRDRFGRATMATLSRLLGRSDWSYGAEDLSPQAAWWLGAHGSSNRGRELSSRLFPDAGVAVMCRDDIHVVVDAGAFGPWGSGHSHSDTLSLTVRVGNRDVLIDPGTYTYCDEGWRGRFRGSAAHNTIKIDGADQATPISAFRWANQPAARVIAWETAPDEDRIEAECAYRGFAHRRSVTLHSAGVLLVQDDISGPAGEHEIEQFWHVGSTDDRERFTFDGEVEEVEGWRSPVMLQKESSPVFRLRRRTKLPVCLKTRIQLR